MLYNERIAGLALGCLMKQPNLLAVSEFPLCKADFSPNKFHQVLYLCIYRLVKEGVQNITEIEIENVAQNKQVYLDILEENDFFDFVETMKELALPENYSSYYNIVRKFSLLRDLQDTGYDTTEFYDELEDEEKTKIKFEKLTIQDILNQVELKNTELRKKFDVKYVRDEITIGEDVDELLEEFKYRPSFGAMLASPLLTTLVHGFSRGNFILRSAPSGTNKTRMAVADMCGLCVDQYYDLEKQEFVDNPNFQGNGLFIHTELDTRREMQPMFWACISGVPSNKITMGLCNHEEELRVKKAAEIFQRNTFTLTSMPDFTSQSLDRKIKESVELNNTQYVCFDYMMLNGPLSMEYKQNTGVQAREDMALRGLATDIKDMAEKYQVGILSMSQTNGNEKQMDFADESCIAGSKAMRNKVDAGFVMLSAKERKKEMKLVEPFFPSRRLDGDRKQPKIPNRITYLYKARFGEYQEQKVKVFHYFDASIMRNTDYFCTDDNNKIINIPFAKIVPREDTE